MELPFTEHQLIIRNGNMHPCIQNEERLQNPFTNRDCP